MPTAAEDFRPLGVLLLSKDVSEVRGGVVVRSAGSLADCQAPYCTAITALLLSTPATVNFTGTLPVAARSAGMRTVIW